MNSEGAIWADDIRVPSDEVYYQFCAGCGARLPVHSQPPIRDKRHTVLDCIKELKDQINSKRQEP
jgi:hypothetical protein